MNSSSTVTTAAASVASLKCSMLAILESISAYTKVHSEWANRAPGLSKDPLLNITKRTDCSILPSLELLTQLAEQVSHQSTSTPPIFGSAWQEHVQFCQSHSDPLPGLGTLRNSVMAELAFLEKFEQDVQDSQAVPRSSNAAFLATIWEEALFAAFNLAPLQEISSSFPLPVSFPSKSNGKQADLVPSSSPSMPRDRVDLKHSAKVDVVAEGGSTWIRIISTRASSLLSEFREAESYLAEEFDDDEGEFQGADMEEVITRKLESGRMDEPALKSSLIQTGLELVAAASSNNGEDELHSGATIEAQPKIQMVLSRLLPPQSHSSSSVSSIHQHFNLAPTGFDSESSECKRYNLRLKAIFSELERMGIEVILGSRLKSSVQRPLPSDVAYANHTPISNSPTSRSSEFSLPILPSPPATPVPFKDISPTKRLNLDLSALIALTSDISHQVFPPGSREARRCGADENDTRLKEIFVSNFNEARELREWKMDEANQVEGLAGFQLQNKGPGPHGRALTQQLIREIDGDQFMHSIAQVASSSVNQSSARSRVELFITREAQQKFWEIINLVAGEREKKRAKALFGLEQSWQGSEDLTIHPTISAEKAEELFWSGSRWSKSSDAFHISVRNSIQFPIKTLPGPDLVVSRSPSTPDIPLSSAAVLALPIYQHAPTLAFARRMCETVSSALLSLDTSPTSSTGTPPVTASSIRKKQNSNNTPPGGGNSKQTRHTLNTLLAGAENGLSTMTTNATSIKWLVKEMGRRKRFSLTANLDKLEDDLLQSHAVPSPPLLSLIWATHPRSLAERMCTTVIISESEATEPSVLPYFPKQARTESMVKNDDIDPMTPKTPVEGDILPLLNLGGGSSGSGSSSSPYRSANFNSSARSLSASGDVAEERQHRPNSKFFSFGTSVSIWLAGPRPPQRHVIKHYPWWPFGVVETFWLKMTDPIAWKEPEPDKDYSRPYDSAEQEDEAEESRDLPAPTQSPRPTRDGKVQNGNSWGRHVQADLRKNWIHWILLTVTFIAWAFGFSFLVKSVWYEASITSSDGTETTPSFFGCTSTYWLLNSRCGLDGNECAPFSSNISVPFRCPSGCLGTTLGGPRAVGDELPAYVPLVVGGGDGVYRGDSFICSAAVHAGLIEDGKGGCGSLNLIGTYSNYTASRAHGVESVPFDSTFPVSFTFDPIQDAIPQHCTDTRSKGYILDVILSAFVGFILRPKRIVYFFTLFCVGFWHINFVSEPRDYPPPIGEPFGDFLPGLFGAYVIWRVAARFVFPAFNRFPIEREVWTLAFWWIGVLLNVVFANVPLNRLVASDIASQPGSLTALIIIIIVVLVIAVNQVRVIRSTGYLPKYLTLAIVGGIIIGLLAAVPTTGLRLHHYIIALALVCFCGFRTRLSLIYCAFLLGMYTNGIGRWGFDGIVQSVSIIIGDGITDSSIPSFFPASAFNSSGIISWNSIPSNISAEWDSFQLLIDDVLRYSGSATALNVTETLLDSYVTTNNSFYPSDNINSTIANQPHYLRLAYYNSQTSTLGDFTKAGTVFSENATFIQPLPGAT